MIRDTLWTWIGLGRDVLLSPAIIGKFISVGVAGAFLDMTAMVTLVEVFGMLEEVAMLIGIELSILLMFVLNEHWTFRETGHRHWQAVASRFGRSHTVRIAAVIVQIGVFVILYRGWTIQLSLAGIDLWLVTAKGCGIVLGTALSYVCESLFTWQIQEAR